MTITNEARMKFAELLKQQIPEGTKQKSIAMEWFHTVGLEDYSDTTVETQFSRCLKGQVAAVRFFFEERKRGSALLEVLKVSEEDRRTLLELADQLIQANGKTAPRLVVDLTRWSAVENPKQLFDAVAKVFLDEHRLEPVVLLVTDTLYDAVPRSFDKHEWLSVEESDEEGASARIADFPGALVASPAVQPLERWLAIHYYVSSGVLSVEPDDAFARFAQDGALPVPAVEHELSEYVDDQNLPAEKKLPENALERRRLIFALRDEGQAEKIERDPLLRLAMARALGVVAVATPRDRIEAELRQAAKQLGMTPKEVSPDELEAELRRANRRQVPPTLLRVGDELHAINPDPGEPEHSRVTVHRFQPEPTWLAKLRAAIADWTDGDFEADPFLNELVERIDPEQKDPLGVLYARSWLLDTNDFTPRKAEPIGDWRGALRTLLNQQVPPAEVIVYNDRKTSVPPKIFESEEQKLQLVLHASSARPTIIANRSRPMNVVEVRGIYSYGNRSPNVTLPQSLPEPRSDDQWLDAYESFLAADTTDVTVNNSPFDRLPDWSKYDSELENVWLSLLSAVEHAPAVLCADGGALLRIGGGYAARITVTRTAVEHVGVRALMAPDVIRVSLVTFRHSEQVSQFVPERIVFLGGTTRAEIRFSFSPLLMESTLSRYD